MIQMSYRSRSTAGAQCHVFGGTCFLMIAVILCSLEAAKGTRTPASALERRFKRRVLRAIHVQVKDLGLTCGKPGPPMPEEPPVPLPYKEELFATTRMNYNVPIPRRNISALLPRQSRCVKQTSLRSMTCFGRGFGSRHTKTNIRIAPAFVGSTIYPL